ncbi:MAG: hypothetical protein Q4C73_11505 [Eubacteriales bacterium]|nr:hypothetical protein [Eubacteriales bacterium]
MYTEEYEAEIDVKDLFFSVLYQWRLLLLAAVIGAAVLGGYKTVRGSAGQTDPVALEPETEKLAQYDAEKLALEKTVGNLMNNIEEQNRYLAEAPLMQINPYKEAEATAELLVVSSEGTPENLGNVLQAYQYALGDGAYLQETAETLGTELRYLQELITVQGSRGLDGDVMINSFRVEMPEDGSTEGILSLRAIGPDSQMAERLLEAMLAEAESLQENLAVELGAHTVSLLRRSEGELVDTGLMTRQKTVRDNVSTLTDSLTAFEKKLDELTPPAAENVQQAAAKSTVKYAVIGFVAGGFAAAVAVCALYILNDKVTSEKEIVNRYRIKNLGEFSQVHRKRALGAVDDWLHRLAGDGKVWPEEAVLEMIAANVSNYADGKKTLFVTGLASEALLDKISKNLAAALPEIKIDSERDLISSASARRRLAECEGVILVEECKQSRYSLIQQELELAGNVGVEVIGVIVG